MPLAVRKAGSKGDSRPALHIVGPKLMHLLILVDDAPLASAVQRVPAISRIGAMGCRGRRIARVAYAPQLEW